jgi:hypothetical protein
MSGHLYCGVGVFPPTHSQPVNPATHRHTQAHFSCDSPAPPPPPTSLVSRCQRPPPRRTHLATASCRAIQGSSEYQRVLVHCPHCARRSCSSPYLGRGTCPATESRWVYPARQAEFMRSGLSGRVGEGGWRGYRDDSASSSLCLACLNCERRGSWSFDRLQHFECSDDRTALRTGDQTVRSRRCFSYSPSPQTESEGVSRRTTIDRKKDLRSDAMRG